MTNNNNDKVRTIFRLAGEVIADVIFPVDAEIDTSEPATVSDDAEPTEETAESDPDMWLSVNDLLRLDCLQKRSSNGELRPMSRQKFADYRADPTSHFPLPGQQNGHRKYWQLGQIDAWIDDDSEMSVDQFIAQRRVGA